MLKDSAIIVITTITATTMKVTDKAAGNELTAQKRADKKAAKVVKNLIDPVHLKNIISVQTAFRTLVQSNTVPWVGDTYLLPKARYYEFVDKVRELQDELEREVSKFCRSYSNIITEAHQALGDLFDPSGYPDVLELRDKFTLGVRFMPVPDFNQFSSLGLEEESEDRLKAEAMEMENDLLRKATKTLFERVHNRVEMLYKRLTDPETKRYRESLLESLDFLVKVMPDLNVTGDKYLEEVMDGINKMLIEVNIDDIRESPQVRADAAAQCDEIMKKMEGMF